jgi:hypothetical protein
MQLLLPCFFLLIVFIGGLPRQGQYFFHYRWDWWPERSVGLASAVLECLFGTAMAKYFLSAYEFGHVSQGKATFWTILGIYFILEGLFRFAANTAIKDRAVPMLPLLLFFMAAERMLGRER